MSARAVLPQLKPVHRHQRAGKGRFLFADPVGAAHARAGNRAKGQHAAMRRYPPIMRLHPTEATTRPSGKNTSSVRDGKIAALPPISEIFQTPAVISAAGESSVHSARSDPSMRSMARSAWVWICVAGLSGST